MKKQIGKTAFAVSKAKQLVVAAVVVIAISLMAFAGCVDTGTNDLAIINQQLQAAPKPGSIQYSATMNAGEVLAHSLVTDYTLAADGSVTAVSTTKALNTDPTAQEAYVTTTENLQYNAADAEKYLPKIESLDKKYFVNERFTLTVEGATTTLQYTPNNLALQELFDLDPQQLALVSNANVVLTMIDAKPSTLVLEYDINQYHAIIRLQFNYTV